MAKKRTTRKSSAEKELAAEIKRMEDAKREDVKVEAPISKKEVDNRISFHEWYAQRKGKIPKIHLKEIILVDFKARGLSEKELPEKFDEALALYGVK